MRKISSKTCSWIVCRQPRYVGCANDRPLVPLSLRAIRRGPKAVRIRHVIPPHWACRRVSTDLILGAPAPSPTHHDPLRGISWSLLSIEAQVREIALGSLRRSPAGEGAGALRGDPPRITECSPYTLATELGGYPKLAGSGSASGDARGPVPRSDRLASRDFRIL